jgi:capsular polysaccharide transport system ATP-binding protein
MIAFEKATKIFRQGGFRKAILDDVTLALPAGKSIGIFGANGAGKSTLVRLIAGVEPLDRGRIRRFGTVSFPLGFGGTFHPHLTGLENVRFLARVNGTDPDEAIAYVEEFAELGAYFRMRFDTYSAGMGARLAFGACLAIQFDLYLIDEVTSVGDAHFRRKCLEAFAARASTSDVLIISHDEGTIRAWCDAGAVLHDGKLVFYEDLERAIEVHRSHILKGIRA